MTKGLKIEGAARVIGTGTATVNGPQECPYVDFELNGSRYRWQSENAGWTHYPDGCVVNLRAFVRADGRRLYRVIVTRK